MADTARARAEAALDKLEQAASSLADLFPDFPVGGPLSYVEHYRGRLAELEDSLGPGSAAIGRQTTTVPTAEASSREAKGAE